MGDLKLTSEFELFLTQNDDDLFQTFASHFTAGYDQNKALELVIDKDFNAYSASQKKKLDQFWEAFKAEQH
jgi:hypothetical protein